MGHRKLTCKIITSIILTNISILFDVKNHSNFKLKQKLTDESKNSKIKADFIDQ